MPPQIGFPTAGRSAPESRPRTPDKKRKQPYDSSPKKRITHNKNPHAGFSSAFFQRECDSCAGDKPEQSARTQEKCDSSEGWKPEAESKSLICEREDSRRRASQRFACRLKRALPIWAYSRWAFSCFQTHPYPFRIVATANRIPPPRADSQVRRLAWLRPPLRGSPPQLSSSAFSVQIQSQTFGLLR